MFTRRIGILPALAAALTFMAAGAGGAYAQCVATQDGSGVASFKLLAGQTIEAGSVTATVKGSALEVAFTTTDGWELTEAHLWLGNTLDDLPQTKTGNPVPGKFPYNSGNITGSTAYTFSIPLSSPTVNFSCPTEPVIYYIAAHAALRKPKGDGTYQTETGWSEGSPITSKGNWAMFSTITLTCDCGGGIEPVCETAFARLADQATCFNSIGFERWGWTNGPVGPGTYLLDIYAGAAQCDLAKGTFVGQLAVDYDGATVMASFEMFDDYFMQETHLYVGNARLPTYKQGKALVETVAPGQYPYIHSGLDHATTDEYTVSGTGSIYLVAHAVVCTE
jgi:hypothetical protein